jgi:hypothetical protein
MHGLGEGCKGGCRRQGVRLCVRGSWVHVGHAEQLQHVFSVVVFPSLGMCQL